MRFEQIGNMIDALMPVVLLIGFYIMTVLDERKNPDKFLKDREEWKQSRAFSPIKFSNLYKRCIWGYYSLALGIILIVGRIIFLIYQP